MVDRFGSVFQTAENEGKEKHVPEITALIR